MIGISIALIHIHICVCDVLASTTRRVLIQLPLVICFDCLHIRAFNLRLQQTLRYLQLLYYIRAVSHNAIISLNVFYFFFFCTV